MGPTRRWRIPCCPGPIRSRPRADGSVRRSGCSWRHAGESLFAYSAVGRFQAGLLFRSFGFPLGLCRGAAHPQTQSLCKSGLSVVRFCLSVQIFATTYLKAMSSALGRDKDRPAASTLMPGRVTPEDALLSHSRTHAEPRLVIVVHLHSSNFVHSPLD